MLATTVKIEDQTTVLHTSTQTEPTITRSNLTYLLYMVTCNINKVWVYQITSSVNYLHLNYSINTIYLNLDCCKTLLLVGETEGARYTLRNIFGTYSVDTTISGKEHPVYKIHSASIQYTIIYENNVGWMVS